MANWFTRAIDTITPWDRGGEVQRRKEREEEERNRWQPQRSNQAPQQSTLRVTNTPSTARVSVDGYEEQPKPEPKKPQNIFENLNKNLNLNRPNNAVKIFNEQAMTDRPKPGTVVKPTLRVENRPNNTKIQIPDFNALSQEEQAKRILERDLNAGKSWEDIARDNRFDLESVKQYSQATRPNYGIKIERPNQSIFDRVVRDRFDANTEADKWRRQQGNAQPGAEEKPIVLENPGNIVSQTPVVGHITKVVNTMAAQIAQLPATIQGQAITAAQSDITKEMMDAQARGDNVAYLEAKYKLDLLNDELEKVFREQDAGYTNFEKNSGGFLNTGTLYDEEGARAGDAETAIKDIALPTAVTALDLYTLGKGNAVAQGIKQQGLRQTVTQPGRQIFKANVGRVPVAGRGDVAKLVGGNYLSGDLDTRAKGGNTQQAITSGLLTSVLGSVPDVILPALSKMFTSRVLGRGNRIGAKEVIEELDDASIAASAKAVLEETTPKPIPVKQVIDVPINKVDLPGQQVNVRSLNEPKPLIQEVVGDEALSTPDALIKQNADNARAEQLRNRAFEQNKTTGQPDRSIDGVKPQKFKDVGNVSRKEIAEEREALDRALADGDITRAQYSAANKELDDIISGVEKQTGINSPFRLDRGEVVTEQAKIVDDYAKQLREMGQGNGVAIIRNSDGSYRRSSNNVRPTELKGKRVTKAMWREEAERQLQSGNADPAFQKAFNDINDPEVQSLLKQGDKAPEPKSTPIEVKEVSGIDVADQTKVPVNTPETPGKVRVTTQKSPVKEKSEAVAKQPTARAVPTITKENEEILANPKNFTKRQVASARNQRKLARQMAKAQEETAEAMERIEGAKPAKQGDEGFAPTGEFKKGRNNNIYERVSKKTEMEQGIRETATTSPKAVIEKARSNRAKNGVYTPKDVRDVEAIIESRRVQRGTPEFIEMQKILKESGSDWGRVGALRKGTKMRRSASANELISRYETKIYGLADDPTKIDSKLFDKVEAAETAYVETRDSAMAAYNRFTENPTTANAKAFHAAQDAADKADIAAKQTEYTVAKEALKGNKDIKQVRELRKLATDADLGKMDYVDSAMLSSTGTMVRNFVNSLPGAIEEGLFGKAAAGIANKTTKGTVGGGLGRNTFRDVGKSIKDFSNKAKVMKQDSGSIFRHPIENLKTWSTLGNELGDTVIDTTARQSAEGYYRKVLKQQGFKGRELTDRLSVMSRADPEDMLPTYQQIARVDAGLSGGNIAKQTKIEQSIANGISDAISAGKPSAKTDAIAKALVRVTVGFPSAVARATATGARRLTGVGPLYDFAKAIRETDPTKKALLMKQSIKQGASSATVIPGVFYTLGNAGMLSGSYPTGDKAEQARWEREGISENSIKIGDAWYQYPAFLGAWSVPAMFWGNMGRTDGDFAESAKDMAKGITDIVPTDQLSRIKDAIEGRYDRGKLAATMGANTVRALTPAGALLNQVAKTFDTTKNDTNSRGVMDNFIDKVFAGIPGGDKLRDIPDKLDDAGNPIQNPSVIQTLTGATSAVQGKGEERTATMQKEVDSALKNINDTGALKDQNLRSILDDETALIYDKAAKGEQLKEDELNSLQDSLVKGVTQEGSDTAYLEREQYDTHLSALNLKKQLMEADPTVNPSKLEKIETAIKRGEVYRDNKIPYDDIADYQDVGVEDWRKMGIPPEDEDHDPDMYDPDMYEKLWQLDQLMTKSGVSYGKELDKNKYYLKTSKSGSGSGSKKATIKSFSGDFGKLKAGEFAPRVREYETIQTQAGGVPRIKTVRPNIVHKISSSR